MTASLLFADLLAWSAQVLIVIACGGLLCAGFRVTAPRPRLLYLQSLLAFSLVAPFCSITTSPRQPDARIRIVQRGTVAAPPASRRGSRIILPDVAIAVLAAGASIRLIWLAMGFARLRRLRRNAERLRELPPAMQSVCNEMGLWPEVYVSPDVAGPVTFGVLRQAVLLPSSIREADSGIQRSITCHELFHLKRGDWAFTLAEETIRAVFWFHPAIWWLLERVHLTREQVVDQEAIAFTGDRAGYVTTLLAVASARLHGGLIPAPLFLRRRHLATRVALIQKGAQMSIRHIVSSLAVITPLLVFAAIAGWQAFPVAAAPADAADSPGVQVNEDGFFRVLHRPGVQYPEEARRKGISGYVVARVTVDDRGQVTDASIVSGPQPLRAAVLASVLKWHFDPDQRIPEDRSFEVGVRFTASAGDNNGALAPADDESRTPPVTAVDVSSLPAGMQEKAEAALRPYVGQTLSGHQVLELNHSLAAIDEHMQLGMWASGQQCTLRAVLGAAPQGGITGGISGGISESGPADAPKRIRVGSKIEQMNLVSKRIPVYPPDAKQDHIQGTVILRAVIGSDGHVKALTLVSGHPLLASAAVDAVKDWVYRPTLLNGDPVEVVTDIEVNFTLTQ